MLKPFYANRTGCATEADREPVDLVPIRLDIEKDGYKIKDTFTWNRAEGVVTPKAFAMQLCLDEELPGALLFSTSPDALGPT